ncbi:MAG TPA: preprotein translocase subunit YajC [Rhodospirillales bacterium]|jgi:preprotein translocase subunit YajC|nr:preprotein translocase subunit YajC [Rhodospirillales bacterium]
MFVTPAYAQDGGGSVGGDPGFFVVMILLFVVMYFFIIRPQKKKATQHKEKLAAIRRGDRVVTGGGIIGTVSKVVDDDELAIDIADGVKVRVRRSLIANVVSKTEPVGEAKKTDGKTVAEAPAEGEGGTVSSGLRNLFGGKDK